MYHKTLRMSALTMALVLVFQSGLLSPVTRDLSEQTADYLSAAVGATASIKPTEINILTAQVTALEQELQAREAAAVERDIAVNVGAGVANSNRTTFLLSAILFVLLVLIILNYVMDFVRSRSKPVKNHEQVA